MLPKQTSLCSLSRVYISVSWLNDIVFKIIVSLLKQCAFSASATLFGRHPRKVLH